MANLRTLLVLGRVSNLPTVWSNCLCAWLVSGGDRWATFIALLAGSSLLYVAGMYLNDYFDADFDSQYRKERPIPSGAISSKQTLGVAVALTATGFLLVAWLGEETAFFAGLLIGLIVVYNVVHKRSALGVPLMAGCRYGLYLLAGAASQYRVAPEAVLAGSLMFLYVLGVTALARSEATEGGVSRFGLLALAASWLAILGTGWANGSLTHLALPLMASLAWSLYAFWKASGPNGVIIIGKTIGPLLAGICLVDWAILSTMHPLSGPASAIFIAFLVAALVAQRRIPAS